MVSVSYSYVLTYNDLATDNPAFLEAPTELLDCPQTELWKETISPVLGDRKGQRFAVAAAVATEVSGEVGRSVHDNLGSTGR